MKENTYTEHFVSAFLDHNLGFDTSETNEAIKNQLSVKAYKDAISIELCQFLADPDFLWLPLFTKYWTEPDSNGLETEEDARDFAVKYIWYEVNPKTSPPGL